MSIWIAAMLTLASMAPGAAAVEVSSGLRAPEDREAVMQPAMILSPSRLGPDAGARLVERVEADVIAALGGDSHGKAIRIKIIEKGEDAGMTLAALAGEKGDASAMRPATVPHLWKWESFEAIAFERHYKAHPDWPR